MTTKQFTLLNRLLIALSLLVDGPAREIVEAISTIIEQIYDESV